MALDNVAIVIPVYTQTLDEKERISLLQMVKIFTGYDLVFVMPEGLQPAFLDSFPDAHIKCEYFDESNFSSGYSYNKLMLSYSFYSRFSSYEYILISQLDVFVFEDRLNEFCSLGYDYIGAPWLEGYFYYTDKRHTMWYVGNGGFSLRRVQSFLRLLQDRQDAMLQVWENEDVIFSAQSGVDFKAAPIDAALRFAFERQVHKCFLRNNETIPFACHGWWKYDLGFIRGWVEGCGYAVPEEWVTDGNLDTILAREIEDKAADNRSLKRLFEDDGILNILSHLWGNDTAYIIWGAGRYGQAILKYLTETGIPVYGVCDSEPRMAGTRMGTYVIQSPDDIYKKNDVINSGNVKTLVTIKNDKELDGFFGGLGMVSRKDYISFNEMMTL